MGGAGGNKAALTLGEGVRGCNPRRSDSSGSGVFMGGGFEGVEQVEVGSGEFGAQFLEAVAIAPRGGVGGQVEQFGDGLEGEIVPELEDDDLPLFGRKAGEGGEGRLFARGRGTLLLEPGRGFEFAGQAAPEAAPVVEGPVAEAADRKKAGFARGFREGEQGAEGLLEHVLGLGMGKAERPSVEDELGGAGVVKGCGPVFRMLAFGMHLAQ